VTPEQQYECDSLHALLLFSSDPGLLTKSRPVVMVSLCTLYAAGGALAQSTHDSA
jgi:hypothetical protein